MLNSSHQLALLSAVCFRMLLVVSLWQGPIAWGHCHDLNDAGMASHIARYHHNDPDAWNLGWHWHFMLPCHGCLPDSDDTTPDNPTIPRDLIRPVLIVSSGTFNIDVDSSTWHTLPVAEAIGTAFASHTPAEQGGFVGTFSLRHPCQSLLCRMTC